MIAGSDIIRPAPHMSMWDWNVQHVDFSLDQSYRAASAGKYDQTLMPWWKGIVDAIDSRTIKEVIVLGISQGGKEEHCLCMPARYWAGTGRRAHILYVGHQEEKAEEIYIDRVKGSMKLTAPTRKLLRTVKERGMIYDIGVTRFGCTHGGTGGGLKGKPWDAVLCSEVSSYKSVAIVDEARKRGMTRPFFKLVVWGCPDWRQRRPSEDDPLFMEFDQTDQREWAMPDPKTGNPFYWKVGDGKADGLYWDASAKLGENKYDLRRVEETAHYITPDGTTLTEADRWPLVLKGAWQGQKPDAPSWKFGAHIHQLMMKWPDVGGFGYIARRYCESLMKDFDSRRSFRYEVEACKWHGEKITIESSQIENRKGSYRHGTKASVNPAYQFMAKNRVATILTNDVQKNRTPYVVREWFDGGDSALVDFGEVDRWKDLATIRAKYATRKDFMDLSYEDRANECYEQCLFGEMKGAVPMFGRDSLKEQYRVQSKDPFEGTAKQGHGKLPMITFNPNIVKNKLATLTDGTDAHQWLLPVDVPAEYITQMTAEESQDGEWVARHKNNHAFDCEVMQLVAAMVLGIFREVGINLDAETLRPSAQPLGQPLGQPQLENAQTKPRKRGVYYGD